MVNRMAMLKQSMTLKEKLLQTQSLLTASSLNRTVRYFIFYWSSSTTTLNYSTATLPSMSQITQKQTPFHKCQSNSVTSLETSKSTFSARSTVQTFSGAYASLDSSIVLLTKEAFCKQSLSKMVFWLSLMTSLSTLQSSMKTTSSVQVCLTFKFKISTATW